MKKNITTWDPKISSSIIEELRKRDDWIKRISLKFNLVLAECGKLRDRINKLQRFEKKFVDVGSCVKKAGNNKVEKNCQQHKGSFKSRMNKFQVKEGKFGLKYPNANKLFLYFNKKVDDGTVNKLLELVDNKKIVSVSNRDNRCIVTFYNKKDRDEVIERKLLDNFCYIDKGYFNMNQCNVEMVVNRDKVSEILVTIEQNNLKESLVSYTQRLINREEKSDNVIIRIASTSNAVKDCLVKLKWLKVNDLGKEKPTIKLHSKKVLNLKAIIQGIYNAWDRIVEEGMSPVIDKKDISMKTSYTKVSKETRYNYLIQLDKYDVANVLYGQIIVVEEFSFKLENPSDVFKIKEQSNDKIKQTKHNEYKPNNLNEEHQVPMEMEDKEENYNNTSFIKENSNQSTKFNANYNINCVPELNNILQKLTESNAFLCTTVQSLAIGIENIHKDLKVLNDRVDNLECKGKRSRDIINEDISMHKASKSNLYYHTQGLSQ